MIGIPGSPPYSEWAPWILLTWSLLAFLLVGGTIFLVAVVIVRRYHDWREKEKDPRDEREGKDKKDGKDRSDRRDAREPSDPQDPRRP